MLQSPLKPKTYEADRGIIQLTQLFGGMDMPYNLLGLKGHNGWDLRTKHFQDGLAPCYASHSGVVVSDKEKQTDTLGRYVVIETDEMTIDGKKCKIQTLYGHLSKCKHSIGSLVLKGQQIGVCGNTGGFTTGAHLHFALYILWKQKDGSYKKEDNGYGGAVDPLPYMIDSQVYQYGDSFWGRKFFYNGKEIKRSEVDALIPPQYK